MLSLIPAEILLGIVRHVLTAVGAYLVSKGTLSADIVESILGAILALAATVWSSASKMQNNAVTSDALVKAARSGEVPAGTPIPIPPSTVTPRDTTLPPGFPRPNLP